MTDLDRLPPDQRAVLSLVLDRGRSYAEVAALLSIPEAAVRERAHAALDALALAGGRAAAASAAAAAAKPSGLSGQRAGGGEQAPSAPPVSASPLAARRTRARGGPGGQATRPERDPRPPRRATARPSSAPPSSRIGGALVLGGIVVVAIVVAIVLSNGGKGASNSATTSSRSTSSSTTAASTGAHIENKFALSPLDPESSATGEAYVLSDGARHAFYVAAKGLPPSHGFFYAVWLYNSPSSTAPLGRAPTVGSNGHLEGGGPLPGDAADFAKLIVTREHSLHATHPGTIVLSGPFALK